MFVEEEEEISFGPIEFEVPVGHLFGDDRQAFGYMILEFKRDLWARDLDQRVISLKLVFETREMDDNTEREL